MKKRGCWVRIAQVVCAVVLLAIVAAWSVFFYPFWGMPLNSARHGNPPLTPPWALECWIWEDDINTAESTLEMVNGHLRHDFPVRTILIDSPWSTRYNDFQVDETRFPNADAFFQSLDERGIRVVLWMTSMINSANKDTETADSSAWFQEAANKGYLLGEDFQKKWWKGHGGFIDYTNPEALAWWRQMQATVLDWGVDGWKLDGAATLAFAAKGPFPWFYLDAHNGPLSTRAYMDRYYRDEYAGGLRENPEFVTLSRSLDSVMPLIHPEGFAPIDASPVNWLGDNTHTWDEATRGLERAIRLTLKSAEMGYNIVGSDIGGYHGEEPIDPELYICWAQFSTFTGLFLNGGHGERRMWKRSAEELEIIRAFSWLHHELVPYKYHYVVTAHRGGRRLITPIETGPFHYLLGESLLIAPMHQPGNTHTVQLPEGKWRYWFDDFEVLEGPARITREFPRTEYPVFVREGAILPMQISRAYTHIGERSWENYLTLNIYPGADNRFDYYHYQGQEAATLSVETTPGGLVIVAENFTRPYLMRVCLATEPKAVEFEAAPLAPESWEYRAETHRLIVRNDAGTSGVYRIQ